MSDHHKRNNYTRSHSKSCAVQHFAHLKGNTKCKTLLIKWYDYTATR